MTEKTIDPIFAPSVLEHAMAMFDDVNFDALKAEPRLEGVVDKNPKTAAIILAGGSGERFGHEGGKQLVEIAGKPILTRSAEVFDAVGDVGLIVIVCPEERMSEYLSKAIDPFPFVTPIVMAPAGSIRQESAFSGLELVPEEYEFVMLHDGARPLITKELIEHTISTLKGNIDWASLHRYVESCRKRGSGWHARPLGVLERSNPSGFSCWHLPPRSCFGPLRWICGYRRFFAY